MIYSDFVNLTSSTSADTASVAGTITYNGVGGKVYFFWASGGDATATAAEARKPYFQVTGNGVPGVVMNLPLGRWRSAYLAGASDGSVSADATALAVGNVKANPAQSITVAELGAASTVAELYQFGVIYGSGSFTDWEGKMSDPWNMRDIPDTIVTATPTDIHTTTETSIGSVSIPADYTNVVGVSTYGVTNGVRVTAEEFIGTCRYTATGAGKDVQFEPAQKWPFFGQQDAPIGTDIQDESFAPAQNWHPISFKGAAASTLASFVTLKTAITNADSFQMFVALKA